jgi:hypothetical protein
MKKPSSSPAIITMRILFDFTIAVPIVLPIGVIPESTPKRKIVSPMIMATDPMINLKNVVVSSGTKVKFNIITRIVIGNTENRASFSLAVITFNGLFLS